MIDRQIMGDNDKVQFNLRVPRELKNRYEEAARKYEREKGTEVGVEVLTNYLEAWIAVEETMIRARKEQKEAIRRVVQSELLKQPMREIGEREIGTSRAGKKGRK